jgi:DHA1 family inner membrane transport protein
VATDGTAGSSVAYDFTPRQWTAMLFVVCCGFSSQMVMPLWVGAVIQDLHLSASAAGRIGSMEFLAVAVISVLVAVTIRWCPTRPTVAVGVALLVLGNFTSAFAGSEGGLIAARLLCGVGKGLVVAIVFGMAAGSSRPMRAFAVLNIVYAVFATFFYLVVPYAITAAGAAGAFWAMGGVAVAGSLFMPLFPTRRLTVSETSGLKWRNMPFYGLVGFAALVILWSGHNMMFTFIQQIGAADGMSLQAIGSVLSLGSFLSVVAPSLARAIDTRLGYGVPMLVATILKIASTLVIALIASPLAYSIAVPAFILLSLFITPYVLGILALADPEGRLAAASSAAMTAGGSLGALLGGISIDKTGNAGLGWWAAAHFLLFTILVIAIAPIAGRVGRAKAAAIAAS